MKRILLDLYSLTDSFSKPFSDKGWAVIHIPRSNWQEVFESHRKIDVIWVQLPCDAFSMASVGSNWKGYMPSDKVKLRLSMLAKALKLIMILRPKYYFIENPVGMLQTLPIMKELSRKKITYCQYGETRQKPTFIWTNMDQWKPRLPCSRNSSCHEAARRGSRKGTEGIKNKLDRTRLPRLLVKEIFETIEKSYEA